MIRDWEPSDLEGVRTLLIKEGWGHRAEDPVTLERVIASATRASVAEVDGAIVGFGRCITDATSNGYLSMIVVAGNHRRRGIGTAIVASLTGSDRNITWVLRAGREGTERFWESVGFQRSAVAFEMRRTE